MRAIHRRRLAEEMLRSPEPSVRWRTWTRVLGEPPSGHRARALEKEVQRSDRVGALLSHQDGRHRPGTTRSVYYKWQGLHWVLASLADLGYPRGAPALLPLRERVLELWLRPTFRRTVEVPHSARRARTDAVPVIQGRARRCASQQGNALYSLCRLGLMDGRASELARLLQVWQWPDGGWNCDRTPSADTSSFMETLTPMLGLWAYGEETGDPASRKAFRRAAEVFLSRGLFRRRSDGQVMDPRFVQTHYPLYWHYDVLGGLKAMALVGLVGDRRCNEALDWLESKELTAGGWPAEASYYRVSRGFRAGSEFVDWGGTSARRSNEWVSTDALFVLRAAGRFDP